MLAPCAPPAAAAARSRRAPLPRSGARRRCTSAAAAPTTTAETAEALLAWCAARGAALHPALLIRDAAAGGRGLFAAQPLPAGTRVARIPRACCISDAADGANAADAAPWPARMAAALLAARADPECAPLVAALPREAVPIGAFAPWTVLREAQLPHAVASAADTAGLLLHPLRSQLRADNAAAVDEDAWRWALSVALSRTCRPEGCAHRLVAPVFDMANHSFQAPELTWAWEEAEDDGGALVMRTARAVEGGDELRISYGEHANDVFYLSYGFLPLGESENAADTAVLFDSLAHAARWLADEAAEGDGGDASEDDAEEARAARLCCGPGAAVDGRLLDAWEAALGGDADAAVGAVRRRAAQLLAALPTTAQQDVAALAGVTPGDAAALPIRFRLAQKQLLAELL